MVIHLSAATRNKDVSFINSFIHRHRSTLTVGTVSWQNACTAAIAFCDIPVHTSAERHHNYCSCDTRGDVFVSLAVAVCGQAIAKRRLYTTSEGYDVQTACYSKCSNFVTPRMPKNILHHYDGPQEQCISCIVRFASPKAEAPQGCMQPPRMLLRP